MYFACIYSVPFDKYWWKKFAARMLAIAVRNSGPKWLQWLLLYGCQIVKLSNCHLTLGQSLSGSDASMVLVHLNRVCARFLPLNATERMSMSQYKMQMSEVFRRKLPNHGACDHFDHSAFAWYANFHFKFQVSHDPPAVIKLSWECRKTGKN